MGKSKRRKTASSSKETFLKDLIQALNKRKPTVVSERHPLCLKLSDEEEHSKKSSSSNDTGDIGVYYLVLGTHCLQRLLTQQQPSNPDALVSLAYTLSKLIPKQLTSGRVLLGRAFVTIALASVAGLPHHALTATLALDHVLLVSHKNSQWQNFVKSLVSSDTIVGIPNNTIQTNGNWKKESSMLAALEKDSIPDNFDSLLMSVDGGRLALKRYSAMAVVWYGKLDILYDAAATLLDQTQQVSATDLRVACRLLRLASEAVKAAGTKSPPPAGLDKFLVSQLKLKRQVPSKQPDSLSLAQKLVQVDNGPWTFETKHPKLDVALLDLPDKRARVFGAALALSGKTTDVDLTLYSLQLLAGLLEQPKTDETTDLRLHVPLFNKRKRKDILDKETWNVDEELSIFIRASPRSLWSRILSILELACQDFPAKRKAEPEGTTRKRRKRGKTDPPQEVVSTQVLPETERHFVEARGEIAWKALRVLTLMMRSVHAHPDNSLSKVQGMVRNMLEEEDAVRMVDLGVAVAKRLGPTEGEKMHEESIRHWLSLLYVTLSVGRAATIDTDYARCPLTPFADSIFQRVAENGTRKSDKGWPLSINPFHRICLAGVLTCNKSDEKETAYHTFVVDGFIEEMSLVLGVYEEFLVPKEECPLSLDDARVVLAAFSRLPVKEQKSSLATLLALVDRFLHKIKSDGDAAESFTAEFCSFLARLLVVTTHAYIAMLFGKPAQDELNKVLRISLLRLQSSSASEYMGIYENFNLSALPTWEFASLSYDKKSETMLQRTLENAFAVGFQVATKDKCHLLYSAWNCLGKHDLWTEPSAKIQVPKRIQPSDYHLLIQELRNDVCDVSNKMSKTDAFHPKASTIAKAIGLRQNKVKSLRSSAADVKKDLLAMMQKAELIVDFLDTHFSQNHSVDKRVDLDLFSLMDASMQYIAFIASCYTESRVNFFVTTKEAIIDRTRTGRERGYSSDSNVSLPLSQCGSLTDEAATDAMERLQDVCECIGGAPSHPDWLDKSCKVTSGVTNEELVEAASKALVCLTRIVKIGLRQEMKVRYRALQKLCPGTSKDRLFLCLSLAAFDDALEMSSFDPYDGDSRDFRTDVAAVCGINCDAMKTALETVGLSRHNVVRTWCPSSAQRVIGQLENLFRGNVVSELASFHLRATGEWEVLLSTSLSYAGVDFEPETPDFDAGALYDVTEAGRWSEICWSVTDCLVPVAALLRFGLCKGGRIQHPLSLMENSVDEFEPEAVEEALGKIAVTESIRDYVAEAIGAISVFEDNPSCNAVVSHLSQSSTTFSHLKGVQNSALALDTLAQLSQMSDRAETPDEAALCLIARIAAIIQVHGFERDNYGVLAESPSLLLACLSEETELPQSVLCDFFGEANPLPHLSSFYLLPLDEFGMDPCWKYNGPKDRYILALLSFVWSGRLAMTSAVRTFFVEMVVALAALERKEQQEDLTIGSFILSDFAGSQEDNLSTLVRDEVCLARNGEDQHEAICALFANLLAYPGQDIGVDSIVVVCRVIKETYEDWKDLALSFRERVTQLGLLYSSRCNRLFEFGGELLADSRELLFDNAANTAIENRHLFTSFLETLSVELSQNTPTREQSLQDLGFPKLLSSCSYAFEKDFREQHWYHCYTCGLTGDKGCCTLCLLLCHKDHDVEYSRYSSFFCDCGEKGSSNVKCQCLEPGSRNKLVERSREDNKKASLMEGAAIDYTTMSSRMCSTIIRESFPEDGREALRTLSEKGRSSHWVRQLFDYNRRLLDQVLRNDENAFAFAGPLKASSFREPVFGRDTPMEGGRPTVSGLPAAPFQLAVASNSGTFSTTMCSDVSEDASKRRLLSSKGATRSIVDSDSRGRSVVAESEKLVFFSPYPVLNTWSKSGLESKFLCRSSFCVFGTVGIGMEVAGLSFSPDFEGLLLVWALDAVKVVILNQSFVGSERILSVNLSGADIGPIVECQWINGSPGRFIVSGKSTVCLFESASTDNTVSPLEVRKKGDRQLGSIVGLSSIQVETVGEKPPTQEGSSSFHLCILYDCGSLESIDIPRSDDDIVTPGAFVLPGRVLKVDPKKDAPSTLDGDMDTEEVFRNSFFQLHALTQSNIVLHQRPYSGVTAISFDSSERETQFELLPFEIPSSILDDSSLKITGPYFHWKELGTVSREKASFYRLCCVACSTKGNVLLIVEFNDADVRVVPVSKPTDEYGTRQRIEGLSVLSAPFSTDMKRESHNDETMDFVERIGLITVARAGPLRVYIEKLGVPTMPFIQRPVLDRLAIGPDSGCRFCTADERQPLLVFEKLKNITNASDIEISADGLGDPTSVLARLISDSTESYLRSPRRDGFTMTVSVRGTDYVIAAIRVLVGSASVGSIPHRLRIMGGCDHLNLGAKRWYARKLNAQEMAMSVRNGFVAIGIEESAEESCHPIVDAIEVYAIERRNVEMWLPGTLPVCSTTRLLPASDIPTGNTPGKCFALSLSSLAGIKRVLGKFKPSRAETTFVTRLIQEVTFSDIPTLRPAVAELISTVETGEELQQSLYDKSALSGCSALLRKVEKYLTVARNDDHISFHEKWLSFLPLLRTCFQIATTIAIKRPFNYLQAMEDKPSTVGQIASDASSVVTGCLSGSTSTKSLISDLVQLALMEIAVANLSPRQSPSFVGLKSLIASPNETIANVACNSISLFCKNRSDIFTAQLMAVKYACDSCLEFIEDTRYTLLGNEQSFDLCPNCYSLGAQFMAASKRGDETNVLIRGKAVGETKKLKCREYNLLQSIPITSVTTRDDRSQVTGAECAEPQQLFDDFIETVFCGVAEDLGKRFEQNDSLLTSLIELCVDLIRHSLRRNRQIEKAHVLARVMVGCLASRTITALEETIPEDTIALLGGLACIVSSNEIARQFFSGAPADVLTDSSTTAELFCEHKEHAPLMKLSEGPGSDNCFYACAREPGYKCGFFHWRHTKRAKHGTAEKPNSAINTKAADFVRELLESPIEGNTKTLRSCILEIVDRFSQETMENCARNNTKPADTKHRTQEYRDASDALYSGAPCSIRRLRGTATLANAIAESHRQNKAPVGLDASMLQMAFVRHALEVTALVANKNREEGAAEWLPILAKIIVAESSHDEGLEDIQAWARLCLRKFCGNDPSKVRDVLNHFGYACKCEKILRLYERLMKMYVMVNEKARQCCSTWQTSSPKCFADLSLGELVGTEHLISEDVRSLRSIKSVSKILNEILASMEQPGGTASWRRFTSLPATPQHMSDQGQIPPIKLMFAIVCGFASFSCQSKALKLINHALTPTAPSKTKIAGSDGNVERSPEDILELTAEDVYSFVMRFVYRAASSENREQSSIVALKLSRSLSREAQSRLLEKFVGTPLSSSGSNGKLSVDFLCFLRTLIQSPNRGSFSVKMVAMKVQAHFSKQLLAIRHDGANGSFVHFEARSGSSIQRKRYDLAACGTCRLHVPRPKEKQQTDRSTQNNSGERASSSTNTARVKWVSDQVSPYVRHRLETGRDSSTSTAFSMFFSLKHRQIVSAIHYEADNPRRFVKTIKVYFSPRPVEKPETLKAEAYADKWKHCGTFNLARGCTSLDLTFSTPVVAANLKIEYADFHDRPGEKSSDGSFVMLCPRCTRAVTNAHGVCGHCGEVAFQCRKCRNIDYEGLDAFLCRECGYCASGTFRFDITGGIVSNAIAITNDDDFKRLQQMFTLAKRHETEVRRALKQKLKHVVRSRKKMPNHSDDADQLGSKALKRAFEGVLPSDGGDDDDDTDYSQLTLRQLGKTGSIVKMIARPQSGSTSWFRAMRQHRTNDSSNRADRILIRNVADGSEDDSADIFNSLLEGSGGLSRYAASLDVSSDPLGQLLANVKSRRENRESAERGQSGDGSPPDPTPKLPSGSSNNSNSKEVLEVCDRLYQLMREAERERAALASRIEAWKRLESGSLVQASPKTFDDFEPSHCSSCSASVANNLLLLWSCLLEAEPQSVVVTKDFIKTLLNVGPMGHLKHLTETRRSVVKTVALRSENGAPLVLEMLRLRITLLDDTSSAEILSKIIREAEGEAAKPFRDLAREALESRTVL